MARTALLAGFVARDLDRRRAAREHLERAAELFEAIGARRWAEHARIEERSVSGRRTGDGLLSPAELRVAQLAAEGRSNKEIADELFLTVRTVESHLSAVYRKLMIRSRGGLAKALERVDLGLDHR
jgi:DNA-binding NarL/FixJ family response regulator